MDSRDSEYINTKDSLMISLFLSKSMIDRDNNIFLDTGCRYFQRSNWKCLRELHIGKQRFKVGGNLISDKGCRYLTKVSWPLLEVLYMDRNEISTIGIMHLFKGLWNHLKSINLCTFKAMKFKTESMQEGSFTSVDQAGSCCI